MIKLAGAVATALLLAGPVMAADAEWPANIKPLSWSYIGMSNDATLQFSRPAPSPEASGHKRLWVRFENQQASTLAGFTYKSSSTLYEFDCAQQRYEMLQWLRYADNNLEGKSDQYIAAPPLWQFAAPGTMAELMTSQACLKQ